MPVEKLEKSPILLILCSARLEAFSDHSGKLQLPLQEIIDWLSQKDEELSAQLPLQGDVVLVQQEKEIHAVGHLIEDLL